MEEKAVISSDQENSENIFPWAIAIAFVLLSLFIRFIYGKITRKSTVSKKKKKTKRQIVIDDSEYDEIEIVDGKEVVTDRASAVFMDFTSPTFENWEWKIQGGVLPGIGKVSTKVLKEEFDTPLVLFGRYLALDSDDDFEKEVIEALGDKLKNRIKLNDTNGLIDALKLKKRQIQTQGHGGGTRPPTAGATASFNFFTNPTFDGWEWAKKGENGPLPSIGTKSIERLKRNGYKTPLQVFGQFLYEGETEFVEDMVKITKLPASKLNEEGHGLVPAFKIKKRQLFHVE